MFDSEQKSAVAPISATIRTDQRAMLIQYGKDSGYISISETLRAVLDEWKRDREREFSQAQQPSLN